MYTKTLRVIQFGGLGDVLLSTPAYKAIKEKWPDQRLIVYCFNKLQQEALKNSPHIDRVTSTSFLRNPRAFISYYLNRLPIFEDNYGEMLPTLFCNMNAKNMIARLHGVELKDERIQIFLSKEEDAKARSFIAEYKNPILMHITSRTSPNQEWEHNNWETLVQEMPGYTFLQLGVEAEKKVVNAVDLRGKLSFRESLGIMKYAKSFVGVNSSFSHATNAFNIPGVVVFGPALPITWGHPNNINLYHPVRCSPCLDLLQSSPCPYNRRCMGLISVDEVRRSLLRQMKTAGPVLVENL